MERCLIAWFHEIALKGKNRRFFEVALRENVKKALTGIPHRSVARLSGRLVVDLSESADLDQVQRRISRVFGIACFAIGWRAVPDLDKIEGQLWQLVQERDFETFKIHSRRTPRSLPFPSTLVNNRLGDFIRQKSGKRVQLDDPDLTCSVEFVQDRAFLYLDRRPGAGGLPARTSGRVVTLLSGGIDSPVAAYKMMKRGCRAIFVHFHSYPHTTLASQEKVRKLVRILNRYQYHSTLYMVPFADCQRHIVAFSPPDCRVVLYRRVMLRIADRIAWRKRAAGLVTGDSLGQVASQTLD
ncbi:MAG: tRNA uracil 4-sulfurtransferase ThiI, partial [Acidobacteriota bacterium]